MVLDELLWKFYFFFLRGVYQFSSSNGKMPWKIIVLVGIPSLTTIAAVGWGALELFSEEKFWRSEFSQAALAPPCEFL